MKPFVDLQVLRASKLLSTAGKGAGEGFLARVHSDMVDQLVLRLERPLLPGTLLPVASMVCDLWSANVVDGQVGHYVVQRLEHLVAHLLRLRIDPLTGHLLLHWLPHVPVVRGHVAVAHVAVVVTSRGSH